MKVTHTAYLLIHLDTSGPIPKFTHAGIYSCPAGSLTLAGFEIAAEVCRETGDSYQEALDKLVETCRRHPMLRWVLPWVEYGYEAHVRRFDLDRWVAFRNNGSY